MVVCFLWVCDVPGVLVIVMKGEAPPSLRLSIHNIISPLGQKEHDRDERQHSYSTQEKLGNIIVKQ